MSGRAHEPARLAPDEDTLTIVKGFLGAYPNMFFQIQEAELDEFVGAVKALDSEENYGTLIDQFGVRRTAPWFWKLSDAIHARYHAAYPIEAGLFDLNRYENR